MFVYLQYDFPKGSNVVMIPFCETIMYRVFRLLRKICKQTSYVYTMSVLAVFA